MQRTHCPIVTGVRELLWFYMGAEAGLTTRYSTLRLWMRKDELEIMSVSES